jgi:hypothetical protein
MGATQPITSNVRSRDRIKSGGANGKLQKCLASSVLCHRVHCISPACNQYRVTASDGYKASLASWDLEL